MRLLFLILLLETAASAQLPSGNQMGVAMGHLHCSPSEAKTEPARGRGIDHIGFEVQGLEQFVKKMEEQGVKFDAPYRKVPQLGIAIAFFTDPWGVYVELTEGLNKL